MAQPLHHPTPQPCLHKSHSPKRHQCKPCLHKWHRHVQAKRGGSQTWAVGVGGKKLCLRGGLCNVTVARGQSQLSNRR
eukprot:3362505-Rhodomonas_salina.1